MATFRSSLQLLSLIAALAVLPACGDGIFGIDSGALHDDRFEATASFSFTTPVASRTILRVDAINGSIDLQTDPDADVIEISGIRTVGAESTAAAQRRLDDLRVNVSEFVDAVAVRTEQPLNTQGRRYEVDYRIVVPDGFRADLDQTNGTIEVTGPLSDLDVTNVNGLVAVDGLSEAVDVTVVNGNVEANMTQVGADVDLSTTNGGVTLRIPSSASASLAAQVVNGTISISGLSLMNQVVTQRTLTGTLGDGQYAIDLATVNGNVSISAN